MIDVNDLRNAVTVLSFLCFAGIVAWAWARSRRDELEECGQIPFLAGEMEERS
jgi:cytochrome c oxidase cbb3-type subunit 4